MTEPVLYEISSKDANNNSLPEFPAVVTALLRLGGCDRAVVSIEPPQHVRVFVTGGKEAIEAASSGQHGAEYNKPGSWQFPSGFAWSLPVLLKPGEGLSQLSQTPVLMLQCSCGKTSKPCSTAADAIKFMQQHSSHNPAWTQHSQELQQQLDHQLKRQQSYQKQQPQTILPIQRTAACICVEVAYLLLRTPSLRSYNWLNQLAQTILYHRVIWYMTSSHRPSSTQLLQQARAGGQLKRSQHLLWLLVGAPPYCQSALALQGGLKHYSLEALSLVTLLHQLQLLPRPQQQSDDEDSIPPTEQQVLAALQQLIQRFSQGTTASGSSSQAAANTVDRSTVEALLRLRGLDLQDIVLAASEEALDTHLDLCVFCGEDLEPPGEQLTQCRSCCHSYHVSCATDPEETGVSWTPEAVAAVKQGTCLGCQGFPLLIVAAAGAGGSSSRSPRKALPWGNAETCSKEAMLAMGDWMLPGSRRLSASPSKMKQAAAAAVDKEDDKPRRRRSVEPEAAAAAGSGARVGSKWPCQPTAAAPVVDEGDIVQTAERYLAYTVSKAKRLGIAVEALESTTLLRHGLLPPGLQLDFITSSAQPARARFEVVAAAGGAGVGGAKQKQQLRCSVCSTLVTSFKAADEHACGRPTNNASKYLKLVGAGDISIKDFLQWLKEREAYEQQQQQQQQRRQPGSGSQTTEAAAEVLQLLAAGPEGSSQQQQRLGRQSHGAAAASPRHPSSAGASQPQFSGQSVAAILEDMADEHHGLDPAAAAAEDGPKTAAVPPPSFSPADSAASGRQSAAHVAAAAAAQQHRREEGIDDKLPVCNLPAGLRVSQRQQGDTDAAVQAAAATEAASLEERTGGAAAARAAAAASASGHKRAREHDPPIPSQQQPQRHEPVQQPRRERMHVNQMPEQDQQQQQVRADQVPPQQQQQQHQQQWQPPVQPQQQQGGSDSSADTSTAPTVTAPADSTDEFRPNKQIKTSASTAQQSQHKQQDQPASQRQAEPQQEQQQRHAGSTQPQQAKQIGQQTQQQRAGAAQQSEKQLQLKPAAKKRRSSQQAKAPAPVLSPADKTGLQHLVKLRWQLCAVPDVSMRYHLGQVLQTPDTVSQAVINKFVGLWASGVAAGGSGGSSSSRGPAIAAAAGGAGGGWYWERLIADHIAEGVLNVLRAAAGSAVDADQRDKQVGRCFAAVKAVYGLCQEHPAAAAAAAAVSGGGNEQAAALQHRESQQQQQEDQQHDPQPAELVADSCRELVQSLLLLTESLLTRNISSSSSVGKVADAVLDVCTAAMDCVSSSSSDRDMQHSAAAEILIVMLQACSSLQKLLGGMDDVTWTGVWKLIRRDIRQLQSSSSVQQADNQPGSSTLDTYCPKWMHGLAWLLGLIQKAPTGWPKVLQLACNSATNQTTAAPLGVSPAAAAALQSVRSKRQPLLIIALYETYWLCKKLQGSAWGSAGAGSALAAADVPEQQQVPSPETDGASVAVRARTEAKDVLVPAYDEALAAVSGVLSMDNLEPDSRKLVHQLVLQLVIMMHLALRALLLPGDKLQQLLAATDEGIQGSVVGYTAARVQQMNCALTAIMDAADGIVEAAAEGVKCIRSKDCRCLGHRAVADFEYLTSTLELTLTVFKSCG